MLQLGTGMQTIEGVTVFPDNVDTEQWWYLPSDITIAKRREDQRPQFTFMKYKRAATQNGVEGGGFLMFAVELGLDEDVERAIRSKVGAGATLTAVPFDSGTVECVALNFQGSGGTVAQVAADGTFTAVEQILGAQMPSLYSGNTAVFSLTLSAEGATLLEAAFAEGATPIGVIYKLTFTAMQPALDVKITADFERIYQHFSAGINANVYYVEVGIEVGLEELVQNGAIKIEVTNYSTAEDKFDQEKMAIDFFKDHLLASWFTPTLTPGTLQGGMATAPRAGGGAALFGPKDDEKTDGKKPDGTGHGGKPADGRQQGGPPKPPDPPPVSGTGGTRPPQPGGQTPPQPGGQTPPQPGGQTPPPATASTVTISFHEAGSTLPVKGRFDVSMINEGTELRAVTAADATASELTLAIPAAWRTVGAAATMIELPVLTSADQDQLRQLFASGNENGVAASGRREAPLGMALTDNVTLDPARPDTYRFGVGVTTTAMRVTAPSAEALVAAVFPGGNLAQPGIYDVRRVSGTNDFLLIGLGEIDSMSQNAAGGGQ